MKARWTQFQVKKNNPTIILERTLGSEHKQWAERVRLEASKKLADHYIED